MHPLLTLPSEIHDIIFTRLSQSTLAQLCLVNQLSYDLCLPHLYRHVHIKIRKQLVQLDKGLQRSSRLERVVRIHTKRLTLTSCQSSYQWLISASQADWCQRWMPQLAALTFCDFSILPMERVVPFLTLPLKTLRFQYCNLVCQHQPEAYIPMLPEDHYHTSIYQLPATYSYHTKHTNEDDDEENVTQMKNTKPLAPMIPPIYPRPSATLTDLVLDWTDFSQTAMDELLGMVPLLTHITLGANHNRIKNANSLAVDALARACPSLHSIKLGLQQIHPSTLTQLIRDYGAQLCHLELQCHHPTVLATIAHHCHHLVHLVLHGVGPLKDQDALERIVQRCRALHQMEIIRWGIRDIPTAILKAMVSQRKQGDSLEKTCLVLDYATLSQLRSTT